MPSAVWTFDVLTISPHHLVKSGEVKFSAAAVLVAVRNKEFLVLSHMAPRLNSDMETSMLFIPHAVFQGFIKRIIHVARHTKNFAG